MEAVILAAGFGTRMFSGTADRPKALLPVAGKPIIDYLVEAVAAVREVSETYVITNHSFCSLFEEWRTQSCAASPVQLIDDGASSHNTRLGAVGDLRLALQHTGLASDLLVMAGDNIFGFSFEKFVQFFYQRGTDSITIHHESDRSKLMRTGVVEVDANWRVTRFQEKPHDPGTGYACPPIYLFRQATLPLIGEYLEGGNNPDAPGNFVAWLIDKRPVHAFLFHEPRYSIGDLASYQEACEALNKSGC